MADALLTRASLLARLGDPQDRAAWQQFVQLYGSLVYGFARQRGLQDADAADLTQEVFLAVARAMGRWRYDPQLGLLPRLALRPDPAQDRPLPAAPPPSAHRQRRYQRPATPGRGAQPGRRPRSGLGTRVSTTALSPGRCPGARELYSDHLAGVLAHGRRGSECCCRGCRAGPLRGCRVRGSQPSPGPPGAADRADANRISEPRRC